MAELHCRRRSGNYIVSFRVASIVGIDARHFNGGALCTVAIPATGAWQSWTTVTLPVTLSAGTQIMTLLFDTGGMNLRYTSVASTASAPAPPPPPPSGSYLGSPVVLPGTIEAENFDNGAEGVAYHDTSAGNTGGAYRSTGVDIEACAEGGYDVGWTMPGEWLNYTVNVSTAGSYVVALRVATPGTATMHVGFNGASSGSSAVAMPTTVAGRTGHVNVWVRLGAGVSR